MMATAYDGVVLTMMTDNVGDDDDQRRRRLHKVVTMLIVGEGDYD